MTSASKIKKLITSAVPSQADSFLDAFLGSTQRAMGQASDRSAQPQTGTHHDRHCQPDDLALNFDPDFIRMHVHQISGVLHQLLMHPLTVPPGSLLPVHYCTLIQMEGGNDGLQRTAMRNQGYYDHNLICWVMQSVERCPGGCSKGLTTYFSLVPCFFSVVNNYVVLAYFAPCGARHIRAELFSRVHVACS